MVLLGKASLVPGPRAIHYHLFHHQAMLRQALLHCGHPIHHPIMCSLQSTDLRDLVTLILGKLLDLQPHGFQRCREVRWCLAGSGALDLLTLDTIEVCPSVYVEVGMEQNPRLRMIQCFRGHSPRI